MWTREKSRRPEAKDRRTKKEEIERGVQLEMHGREEGQVLGRRREQEGTVSSSKSNYAKTVPH